MEEIRGTIQLDANISNARKGIEQLAQTFQNMGGEKGNSFLNTLTRIEKEIDKLENKSGSSVTKIGDFTPAEKSTEKISLLLKKLQKDIGDVDALSKTGKTKLFPPDVANNIKNAADAIKVYTNSKKASESKSGAIGKATAEYNKQTREVENLSQKMAELENKRKSGTTVDQSGFNNQKKLVTDLTQQYDSLIAKVENAKRARDEYAATGGKGGGALKNPSASKPYQNLDADYQEALKQAEEVKIKADEARQAFNNMYIPSELEQELEQTSSKLEQAKIKAEEMKTNLADVRATAMNKSLEEAKEKLKGIADIDLNSITSMEDLERVIEQLTEKGFQELETATNSAKQGINGLAQENDKMNSSLRESKSELQEQNRVLEDINGLKSRIQYFFSLTNTAMLARRAIQQAFETVKELDAAMTETAVVTDFSIGDMWEKLPEYTKMANELGVSTKGVYEASTLYYQQGLQTEEVMALTNETLKMARIAGLECADATNLMTAALRGFNMEINETSAQRVNDVYSELAAITAADTNEIATAMTKTASIASSANMEFETTAALLAQMIETTREPAETAGTAMKTIIARFTEMKKAASDIVNVDGEEVSVNKVDAALASVGVSLKNTKGEFRDLDDVLLELASKWNSLDIMSQRYIATTAAGSRQQSRFIAMMQDYERTMELVDAAYNSAGSSSQQFAKTQESLESKLARLKNAWDTFLMGIADDKIVKGFVDILTGLINAFNKITEKADGLGGSLLRVGAVFLGLRAANAIVKKLITSFVTLKGEAGKLTFLQSLTQRLNNFKVGKGFTLNADVDSTQAHGKLATLKADIKTLKATLNEPMPTTGMMIGLQEVEGKLVATSIIAEGTTEAMEFNLSEAGTAALLAAKSVDEFGDEFTESGIEGKTALDILQKELAETIALQEAAKKSGRGGKTFTYNGKEYVNTKAFRGELESKKVHLQRDVNNLSGKTGKETTVLAQSLKSLLPLLGKTAIVLAAIAAVSAAIYAAWYNMDTQKAQREFERASETAASFQTRLQEIKTEVQELNSAWDSLKEQQTTLDGLVKGTQEWKEALAEYNRTIVETVKNSENLDYTVDDDGKYVIDEKDFKAEKIRKQKQLNEAELNSQLADGYAEYTEIQAQIRTMREMESLEAEYADKIRHSSEYASEQDLDEDEKEGYDFFNNVAYLWSKQKADEARSSLGLKEGYSQEDLAAVNNSALAKYQKIQKNAYSSYLIDKGYSSDIAKASGDIVSSSLLDQTRKQAKEDLGISDHLLTDGLSRSNTNAVDEWAKYKGYDYNNGKITDSEGKEIKIEWVSDAEDGEVTNEQIANELVQFRTVKRGKERATNVAEVLKTTGTDIAQLYNGQWQDIDENTLAELAKNDSIASNMIASQIMSGMKAEQSLTIDEFDRTANEPLADYIESVTGKTIEQLKADKKDTLIKNIIAQDIVDQAINTKKVADEKKTAYKKTAEGEQELTDTEKAYNETIDSLSNEELSFLSKQEEAMKAGLGDVEGQGAFAAIKDAYVELSQSQNVTEQQLENFRTTWGSINWSSPLDSLESLNGMIANGKDGLSEMALATKNVLSDNFLNSANQLKEVLNAEDFAEVSQELYAIYDAEGEITFDNIQEATEKSSTLKKALENGTITATGYAKVMEMVSDGTLSFTDATSGLIDAITEATRLMDTMDKAYKRASEYDFGKSYTDIGNSYKDAAEAVKQLAAGGAWGDPQFDKYMEYIVGQQTWADALKNNDGSTKAAYQSLQSQVEGHKGTMLQSWQSLENDSGNAEGFNEGESWLFDAQDGQVIFNLDNISSTNDLINQIMEGTTKTREEAEAMVADAVTYSDELSNALEKADKMAALNKLLEGKSKNSSGGYTLTDQEMSALGIDEDFLKNVKTKDGHAVTGWTDEARSEAEAGVKTNFADKLANSGLVLPTKSAEGDTAFAKKVTAEPASLQNLQEQFNSAVNAGVASGLSPEAAKQAAIQELASQVGTANAQELGAGLVAGYTDPQAQVAAATQAAAQAKQFYTAIYTAIVSAMADAYGASTGFGGEKGETTDSKGKKRDTYSIDANTRYVVDKETGQAWKQTKDGKGNWSGDYDAKKNNYTADYQSWTTQQKAKENSASTAEANASQLFTTESMYKAMYGEEIPPDGELADAAAQAEVDSALGTVEDPVVIVDANGDGKPDEEGEVESYEDGGKTGVNTGDGSGSEEQEASKTNYGAENADNKRDALERKRTENDREADLIGKLPEEIQGPLMMANMAEDMLYEYEEIKINQEKLTALEDQKKRAEDKAKYLNEYYYYDEATQSYMYDEAAMMDLSDEEKQKVESEKESFDGLAESINAVKEELSGGKIQRAFLTAGKTVDAFSKALKDTKGKTDDLGEAFEEIGKKYGLGDQFKALGQKIEGVIDSSEKLDKEFEGLGIVSEETLSKLDSLPIGEDTKNLIKNTFGTNQGGTVGSWTGDLLGAGGEMLTGIGDVLNFDMMSMGLDMFNQTKDMASQMIQYVVQFVQTIVSWWTNREDWLYNLLSAIEQEVRNFNRQGEVEERFRLYSDEGLEELVSAWKAMRVSLEKQIDLNEQLIQSRQAELQFLNLTNLPFSPAFYYDYEEERVIENPWVYDIYSLLLDIGAMIPEIGGIFSSIKQLMEDNKQRMESAVSEIEDARDEILELEKQQLELRTKYMDDEIELEELVMDAIIEKQQEEIDELTAMNDAIVEGNQKLIDALNEKLELIRQQRENEDREEELGQKERRLAFLRQDTSNANRKEILDLTDELKKDRRDYTDELIDQKISALEKQNDEAAEQRQKQIDLMQEQLDYTEKYGLQWAEAQTLIKNGFDSEGRLRVGTDLYNMLMSKEDFTSLGFGSTRQVKQLMDWDVTNIAAAAFRTINDVWEQGFGNFAMSNDVHEQGSLHLWADREIEYRQLPSWLSFLQPAYNSIQDYLWRTGNNIGAFAETAYGSDKNSTSILGKTLIPALENLFGSIKDKYNDYISVDASETGGAEVFPGIIGSTLDSRSRDWGERSIRTLGDGLESIGRSLTDGLTKVAETNTLRASASSQNIGDMTMNFYINSEDEENGPSIASSIIEAFREGVSNLSIFK